MCCSVEGIASAATAIKSQQVHAQISTAVAAKQLDAAKQQGAAAVQLIEQAAQISATHIDVRA